MPAPDLQRIALARLRGRLLRRRFLEIDPRLRLEVVALAFLVGAFLFWQCRVPFDGLHRAGGERAVAARLAALLAALVAAGGMLAAIRFHHQLRDGVPGPPWLALPIFPSALMEHLRREAAFAVIWVASAAPGILIAAWNLVSLPALLGITLAFTAALVFAGRAGAAIGERFALSRFRAGPLDPRLQALVASGRTARIPPAPAARWVRSSLVGALLAKDLRLARRRSDLVSSSALAIALLGAAAAIWWFPQTRDLVRFAALALTLLAATQAAQFLLALAGSDPFTVLRGLPIGAGALWSSRAIWAAGFAALAVVSQALSAHALPDPARGLFLGWVGAASFAIALLGVHYGMTLFPRSDLGSRLLQLSLSLAMAASLMIPLLGWIILLTAVIHSGRRVPRWSRLESPA